MKLRSSQMIMKKSILIDKLIRNKVNSKLKDFHSNHSSMFSYPFADASDANARFATLATNISIAKYFISFILIILLSRNAVQKYIMK